MDKIKILAAVLALAGCMENGIGMQENIEINNGNVILHSADTNEWNSKISKAGFPKLKSIELRGIDFDEYSDLSGLNAVISMFDDVTFTECKNFPKEISGLHDAKDISFINCGDTLNDVCWMLCSSCYYEYLDKVTYKHYDLDMYTKYSFYECALDYLKWTKFDI